MGILGSGSIHMESRYARKPVSGRGASAATTVCQKCLQVGHWTYECKNAPAYQARPTRTKQLTDPKYRPRFLGAGELLPESRGADAAARGAQQALKGKGKGKKKKKGKGDAAPSSSSSDSGSSSSGSGSDSSSSDSDSSSSSGSSSSDDSSSSSGSDSSSSSGSDSSSSDSDASSSGSDSDSSSSGVPAPRAKQKGGRASKHGDARKAEETVKTKKAVPSGGAAQEQGQPDQARCPEPGSNGAEASRGRKRHEWEREDDRGARAGGEADGLQRDHPDADRNGSSAGHAALPPRKKALRSVVVAAQ